MRAFAEADRLTEQARESASREASPAQGVTPFANLKFILTPVSSMIAVAAGHIEPLGVAG